MPNHILQIVIWYLLCLRLLHSKYVWQGVSQLCFVSFISISSCFLQSWSTVSQLLAPEHYISWIRLSQDNMEGTGGKTPKSRFLLLLIGCLLWISDSCRKPSHARSAIHHQGTQKRTADSCFLPCTLPSCSYVKLCLNFKTSVSRFMGYFIREPEVCLLNTYSILLRKKC